MNRPNVVEKRKVGDQVLTFLRKDIMLGRIERGTHLKESVLSKELGVSRGPIREAIAQLEKEGLVYTPQNGRTIVEGYSVQDIENLYRTRVVIEKYALSQLDYKAFEKGESELQYYIQKMEEGLDSHEKAVEADLQFHLLLVSFSENKTLIQIWKSLHELTKTVIEVTQDFTMTKEIQVIEKHKQIYHAIRDQQIEQAQKELEEHLKSAFALYINAIKELGVINK